MKAKVVQAKPQVRASEDQRTPYQCFKIYVSALLCDAVVIK